MTSLFADIDWLKDTHPDVEVSLAEQGAEVIVKINCHFIHLICVSVHWKHTPSTVRHLYVKHINVYITGATT